MTGATLAVAMLSAVLALSRRQAGAALGVIVLSMLLWPEYLRIPFGPVQMSVPRFVALLLLIKLMAQGRLRSIRFGKVDVLVILIWVWTVLATFAAGAEFSQVSQMIGRGLDTVLVYFVARMALTSPEDAKSLYWGLALTALAMCAAGVYEALTWNSPYHRFSTAAALRADGYEEIRYGMLRAQASTTVSIYFGLAMMLVTGLLWSIRGYAERAFAFRLSILAAFAATLSSLSSGPWLAMFMLIGMNLFYRRPSMVKPLVYALIILAIALEIASNRHFYNLIDYLALDKHTAWYRTRLLEVAFSRWSDYWLFGVGSNWPHHWGAMVDGRLFVDVVNNFLIIALYGGLPAMFMYVAAHVVAIRRTVRAFRADPADIPRRKLLFGLAAALVALDVSSMSVGLYGPALLLSHLLLGFIVSAATAWPAREAVPNRDDEYAMGARIATQPRAYA